MAEAKVGARVAERLLEELRNATQDVPGVTRDSYGVGEQIAHNIVRREAERLDALVRVDSAGNLYMTRPGADPSLPAIILGSHLDSVPHGGNYDGAAGVVAGLAVLAELHHAQATLKRDLIVMAIRAEEAVWFPLSYPGAEAALGVLPASALQVCRIDTGRTLFDHMQAAGFDAAAIGRGEPQVTPDRIAVFLELHIEQGPRLLARGTPLGIVSAINGGFRFTRARCIGAYAHSGAEPRMSRRDSVLGFSDLVQRLDLLWDDLEAQGRELTITVGRVESDPTQHGGSRVLGELGFTIDVRCEHREILDFVERSLIQLCEDIGRRRGVCFDLGDRFTWAAVEMDPGVVSFLLASSERLGTRADLLASGAGHDTAVFAAMKIPTGMVFVRNSNGSHNPDEHMDLEDLDAGVAVLLHFVMTYDTSTERGSRLNP